MTEPLTEQEIANFEAAAKHVFLKNAGRVCADARASRALRAEVERLTREREEIVTKVAANKLDGYRELGAKCAELEARAESAEAALAEARGDAERLDWLEAHPRDASIRIGTDIKPAIFWGVSAEPGTLMRAAIDAAIAADAKSKPEMGRRAQG